MKRLKEASTWAGLAALCQMLKTFVPQYAIVLDGATAVSAALAGVIPEKAGAA